MRTDQLARGAETGPPPRAARRWAVARLARLPQRLSLPALDDHLLADIGLRRAGRTTRYPPPQVPGGSSGTCADPGWLLTKTAVPADRTRRF